MFYGSDTAGRLRGGAFHAPEWRGFPSRQAENEKADTAKTVSALSFLFFAYLNFGSRQARKSVIYFHM